MPNQYVIDYVLKKRIGTNADAVLFALNNIKNDKLSWGVQQHIKAGKSFVTKGIFKEFYDVKATQAILEKIDQIITDIHSLSDKDNNIELISILSKHFKESTNEVRILLQHAIKDLASVEYTTRPSNLIQPSPMEILTQTSPPYHHDETWSREIEDIFAQKKLKLNAFIPGKMSLNNTINEHIKWAFDNIYSIPYPGEKKSDIARSLHGIQHVSRAAFYVPIFANLYRKYGDQDALQLNNEDIKLLQIAAVFHDAAREDEGEDKWDHESAILLYLYLTRVLQVPKKKATLIAEAMANKDPSPANGYFEIQENHDEITWRFNKSKQTSKKNIYQKIIHDVDSLDIIRARPNFDANHLDFYKDNAHDNQLALEEMATLITQARSLITLQGDTYKRLKKDLKLKRENEKAYSMILSDIDSKRHNILHLLGKTLLSENQLQTMQLVDNTPYDEKGVLSEIQITAAIREGKVFVRGIATPSAQSLGKHDETFAELELRKMFREHGMATQTTKENKHVKHGNPYRSVSMIGYGSSTFTSAGFLIVNPNLNNISKIIEDNADSGRGKKSDLRGSDKTRDKDNNRKGLAALNTKLKLGGSSTTDDDIHSTHNEILYDIDKIDAIYFSNDPNLYNDVNFTRSRQPHHFAPILQAIYLRNQYKIQYELAKSNYIQTFGHADGLQKFIQRYGEKSTLPIFEYSGIHNSVRNVSDNELTDENIIHMWVSVCSDFIKSMMQDLNYGNLETLAIEDIKTISIYGASANKYAKSNAPADLNYPPALKEKINAAIQLEKEKLIAEHGVVIAKKIKSGQLSCLDDEAFLSLMISPALCKDVLTNLLSELNKNLSDKFFDQLSSHDLLDFSSRLFDDNLFLTSDINKLLSCGRLFEPNIILKMYCLSTQIDDVSTKNHVKTISKRLISKLLDKVKNQKPNDLDEITAIIKLTEIIGITEEYRNNINETIDSVITKQLQKLYEYNLQTLSTTIDFLTKCKWLQPHHKQLIKPKLETLTLASTDYLLNPGNLRPYLHLASICDLDIKENLTTWLSNHKDKIYPIDFYRYRDILIYFPPDSNLDIFKLLVDKLNFSNCFGNNINLTEWKKLLKDLHATVHKNSPTNSFTQEEIQIVNQQWEKICDQFLKQNADSHSYDGFFFTLKHALLIHVEFPQLSFPHKLFYDLLMKLPTSFLQTKQDALSEIYNKLPHLAEKQALQTLMDGINDKTAQVKPS